MNSVNLVGRLTRDPELRYTPAQMAICRFSIAIDRPKSKDGTQQADFPNIVAFGKLAENCERYLNKGRQVAINGRIQTGSYEKQDGTKVFTTEVVAATVDFIGKGEGDAVNDNGPATYQKPKLEIPDDFAMLDEDVPF